MEIGKAQDNKIKALKLKQSRRNHHGHVYSVTFHKGSFNVIFHERRNMVVNRDQEKLDKKLLYSS